MTNNKNINFYNDNAESLNKIYGSVTFETIHKTWSHFLKSVPLKSYVLDVGAGNGRDANALSSMGYDVTAVEPASSLSSFARNTPSPVSWINDSLPHLNIVKKENKAFSVILLSAIWMHLSPKEQDESLRALSSLLSESGIIIISLRHGEFSDGRTTSNPTVEQLELLLPKHNLKKLEVVKGGDELNRGDVYWSTVVISKFER